MKRISLLLNDYDDPFLALVVGRDYEVSSNASLSPQCLLLGQSYLVLLLST